MLGLRRASLNKRGRNSAARLIAVRLYSSGFVLPAVAFGQLYRYIYGRHVPPGHVTLWQNAGGFDCGLESSAAI